MPTLHWVGKDKVDSVQWWHRNLSRGKGFRINGFLDHYPDFIVRTRTGRTIVLETKRDDRGCISLNFVDVQAGQALVHGNEVLAMSVTGYDKSKTFRQSDHTLENIEAAIRGLFAPNRADGALTELAGYMVLDALIGNTDRHHENWGLLAGVSMVPGAPTLGVAPSFDHASSLGRKLRDERRVELLQSHRIDWYFGKARGGIFRSSDDPHGANPL